MSTKKKDVLFLCQYFYPEYISSATLPFDTAVALSEAGFSVGVLCGYPKEYCSVKGVPLQETHMGVEIKRLRYLQLRRSNVVGRLVNYFSFVLVVLLHFPELRRYRVIIVYSNPPILPIAAALASMCFDTKVIFVSYDVYPEIAIATNTISEGSLVARVMRLVNRLVFRRVTKVVALSDDMKRYLLKNRSFLSEDQVEVICNWHHGEVELDDSDISSSALIRQLKSDGDFVVSYLGNMGICQELDTIIDAIRQLRAEPHIKFLFAGHGSGMEVLRRVVTAEGLQNVTILGFLRGQDFHATLAVSDCFLLSLAKGLTGLCFPSKLYSYLMAGRPVIAIVDSDSGLAKDITDTESGFVVNVGDSHSLVYSIKALEADEPKRLRMGANCKNIYQKRYARSIGTAKYVDMVAEILGS